MKRNNQGRDSENIADEAALWLVRRDRGLTPAEQDEYIQWLTADPRHAEAVARHAAAFERMMKLYEWQPGHSTEANPDLFAPPQTSPWVRWGLSVAAAAAATLSGIFWWGGGLPDAPAVAQGTFLRVNESQVLPDGTVVELKDGSRMEVGYSGSERRVQIAGEAHFRVARDPVPFVVYAAGVTVRAVGTAFNVRAEENLVDVLVVEGTVVVERAPYDVQTPTDPSQDPQGSSRMREIAPGGGGGPGIPAGLSYPTSGTVLVARQRALVSSSSTELRVTDVTDKDIADVLDWKVPRLQFNETPLAVAVEEFNRWNQDRLVIGQRDLREVPIGGTFRIDNIEGFIRLLEITLNIRAEQHGDGEVVLRR